MKVIFSYNFNIASKKMDIEDDEPITNPPGNRGSLTFFDEDKEDEQEETPKATPTDNIKVNVLSCDKEGSDYKYNIRVMVNGEDRTIQRWYKDLLWLHRFLSRNLDLSGYILPAFTESPSGLPDLPGSAIIGSGEGMFGGLNRRHCLRMESFLSALASHRYFSENHIVKSYLTSTGDINSVKEKLSGAVWSSVTKVYSDYQLGKIQDPDDKLDAFFKYVCNAINALKSSYENCSVYIFKWQKLAVTMHDASNETKDVSCVDKNPTTSFMGSVLFEVLLDVSVTEALVSLDGALSLAAALSRQQLYLTECKEMLLRRLAAHQALVTATHQLDKATKPEKKELAQRNKDKAEEKFTSISTIAKTEVELFKSQYQHDLKQSLLSYTEAQVAHARRTMESLASLKAKLLKDSSDEF